MISKQSKTDIMRKVFTYLAGLLLALSISFPKMAAQNLYPGDINNNGLVNGVDMLYWGVAYEQTGPIRPVQSVYWQPYALPTLWSGSFPGGPNFAYADCNGDGRVTGIDLNLGVRDNYGRTHGTPQLDDYRFGQYNVDPLLHLKPKSETVGLGNRVEYEIFLGEESLPVEKFHGITFIISYDKSVIKHNAATFEAVDNPWFVRTGNSNDYDYRWVPFWKNDLDYGSLEVALFKYDNVNSSGHGKIGEFSLVIKENININTPSGLDVKIEAVMMIGNDVTVYPVATKVGEVILSNGGVGPNCPDMIDPVCGSNGVTYINSCYAEAAGVTEYTSGVCFSDCIDPQEINPDAVCTMEYEPVCGCNEVTYMNACAADAAGVINYMPGPCSDNNGCYDPVYVVTNSGTNVNYTNGAITLSCDDYYEPVCGCNGVTYQNACYAEASGITFYTQGTCGNTCVDPANMDPDPVCTQEYDPVCGCNGVTYPNACAADAAGLVSYSAGPCGVTSPWCLEATQVQCGDFLAYETTEGAGNQIENYPGCTPHSFAGNDKVYVLHKSTAGDLQIGLEIMTPGVDLDLFLLKGSCDEVSCIRASLTDNQNTNNEGIILEDAPIGTYYIVVDAQHSSAVAEFRLEVNCGYLVCGDAVPLTCGEPYFGNNGDGHDNVSLYGCDGNVLNVENNGPERVHYFTLTEPGAINIYLGNMTANLELFLLRSCDRGECIDYSQRPGNSYEVLSAYLQAGTYYIVVDGYNGAVSDYALTVSCSSTCDFELTGVIGTGAGCGQSNGSISINSEGGTPGFLVFYEGPISGSFSTTSNNTVLQDVPPGTYHIKMVDANGCSDETTVEVPSSGGEGLSIWLEGTDVSCGQAGSIHVTIENGTAPYDVYVSGPESASLTTDASSFNLENLWAGEYTVYVKDLSGCTDSKTITIGDGGSNFSFTATPTAATCGGSGSIKVVTANGSAPYTISLDGPVSGSTQTHLSTFTLVDLPGGTYKLKIEDGNWCSYEVEVTIDNSEELDIYVEAEGGVCGNSGSILITMSNGQPVYGISWSGPVSGSASTSNDYYLLEDLPSGTYSITVEDSNWCSEHATVQVSNSDGSLTANIVGIDGQCGEAGGLWIDIVNGAGPYQVTWEGPTDGSFLSYETAFDIPDLPGGSYTVKIKDDNDCSVTEVVYVNERPDLSIDTEVTNGTCGEDGSLWVSITGGQADYIVSWDGPVDGSATTDETNYGITGLPTGTYTIHVTDASNCTDYQVVQITSTGEALDIDVAKSNPTCGANNGYLWVDVNNGTGPYTIKWSGPLDGSVSDGNGNYQITNLVAGSYSIEVEDANGCYGTLTKTLYAEDSDLDVELIAQQPACGEDGEIKIKVNGGSKPYQIKYDGPASGTIITNAEVYVLSDLASGDYTVKVTEDGGCSFEGSITLDEPTVFDFGLTAVPGECGQQGALRVIIGQGTSPYHVSWTGPSDGSFSTDEYDFSIADLASGDYSVEITDDNGCSKTRHITLTNPDGDADFLTLTAFPGDCGAEGRIKVQVSSDAEKPYQVSWTGASEGSATTTASSFFISNLDSGTYTIKLVDDNGCSDTGEITLDNDGSPVDLVLTLAYNECELRDIIKVDVVGGEGPYTVGWDGPESGETTFDGTTLELADMASGSYSFKIEDANGCGDNDDIVVPEDVLNLFDLAALNGDCENEGAIKVDMNGGEAEFKVTWTGPVSGETTTASTEFSIPDLPSGDYEVSITDANGCSDTETVTIANEGSIDVDMVGTDGDCTVKGHIYVKVNDGEAPFLISWSGDAEGSDIFSSGEYFIEDLAGGTYTVEVSDDRGCSSTEIITIEGVENTLDISIEVTDGTCITAGSMWVNIGGGTAPVTVSWDGPVSGSLTTDGGSNGIDDLPRGTYTIKITDANGCTDSYTRDVAGPDNDLEVSLDLKEDECGSEDIIAVTITGGDPNYKISWDGPTEGSTTIDGTYIEIPDLLPGTYTVDITDDNGCTASAIINVTASTVELLEVAALNGDCEETGELKLAILGGTPNYTIEWSGADNGSITTTETNFTISDLPAGEYTVKLTDANGCTDESTVTITVTEGVGIRLVGTDGDCTVKGHIYVDVTEGTGPFTIKWTGDAEGSDTFTGNEYFIEDLIGGTYTVEVTNEAGCSQTESVTIEGVENTLDASLEVTNGVCTELGSFWVNIGGGVAPITISWDGPVNGNRDAVVGQNAIENLPSGSYTIVIEDANGCKETIEREVENQDSDLSVTLDVKDDECGSQDIIAVTISGGSPNYKVSWSGPTDGSSTISGTYIELPNLIAGTYTVDITDDNGCITTASATVNAGTVDLLDVVALNGECEEVGELKLTITGGTADYTIEWSGADEGSITTSETTITLSDLPAGDYTVKLTDANGCTDESTATIAVTEGVGIRLVGTNGDCTVKGHIFVDVTEGTGPFAIKWTGEAEGSDTFDGNEYFITDLLGGTYTVEVTNDQGCSQTESVTIEGVENTLDISLEVTNGDCGQLGSFWVNIGGGVAPITISWTGPVDGNRDAVVGQNAIEDLPSGSYTIEIEDANGCKETIIRAIENQGSDLAIDLDLKTDDCGQEDIITVTITGGSADYDVKWTGPVDGSSTISGTYLEIPDLIAGEYKVTVVDAGACETTKEIVVNTSTVELLDISALPGVCEGTGDLVLSINGGSPSYTLEWAGPSDGSATTDNDSYVISEIPSGDYTVSLTDANGCTDVETFTLNNGEGVQITVIATDGDCYQEGSIFVGMDGGIKPYRIEWEGPEDGNFETDAVEYVINDLEEGIYTISVLDEGGCIDTKVVTVNGFATDLSATIEGTSGDCGSVGSIELEISGGQSPYVINWSGASSGNTTAEAGTTTIDDLGSGTYAVVVTDANGCIVSREVEIHNGSGFSVDVDPSNGGCGSLGSIWVEINGGTAEYLITWTGTESGAVSVTNPHYDIENLPAGSYEVKVTDNTGCSITKTVTIETAVDDFEASILAMGGDCGEPGKIIINMSGGTPEYKISWSSTNSSGSVTTNGTSYEIDGLPTGIYNVTVKDDNNCTVTKSLQVLNANNWISLFISSTPVSCTAPGSIGVSFNGGASPYKVSWTGPVDGDVSIDNQQYIINDLPTGTYEVRVEDSEGCSNSETVYVGVANDDIIADFTYDMIMLKVDFINNSSSGTYHWDFGNGTTSSEKDPWIEYAEPGTYQVCLSVTNDCGTKTRCEYIELVVPNDAVILDAGEKLGSYGSTVYVPVTIDNCNLLVSLAGSLELEDTDVAEIIGVSPGAIAPTFNSTNNTFNYYDNNGVGVTLDPQEVLFNIVVKLIGSPGDMSAIFITDDPLMVEVGSIANGQPVVKPHLTLSGKVTVTEHALVEGTVNNYRGLGIEDAEVRISSQVMDEMEMTDENGYFSLAQLEMGEEYTITAAKDDNPVNGLSTFALFIGQRFILGMDPPQISSPYQVIAGDANCNGAFTTLDLFIIQQLIIGTTQGFADCPSWVFVSAENELPGEFDAYNVFPYQDRYEMMVDHDVTSNFIGVKVGDILGQAVTTNLTSDELDERGMDDELVLSAIDRPIAAGETVELTLNSGNFADMVSYQFGIDFDTQKLEYQSFEGSTNTALSSVALGESEAQNGGLKVSWFSMDGAGKDLSGEEDLLTIRFTALTAIPSLAEVVDISSRQLKIEAVNTSLDQFDVVLEWQSKLTDTPTTVDSRFKLYQNTPNPFQGNTDIRFELPSSMEAEMIIHDNLGRIIKRIERRFEAGMNTVELRDLQLEGGVYYYTLRAGEHGATRHMVILN